MLMIVLLECVSVVNSLPPGKFCMLFCRLLIFSTSTFLKHFFRNTIRVPNSLDPDQVQYFVGPDLGPKCLQSYQQTTLGDRVKLH